MVLEAAHQCGNYLLISPALFPQQKRPMKDDKLPVNDLIRFDLIAVN